jgi:hypothetical protein
MFDQQLSRLTESAATVLNGLPASSAVAVTDLPPTVAVPTNFHPHSQVSDSIKTSIAKLLSGANVTTRFRKYGPDAIHPFDEPFTARRVGSRIVEIHHGVRRCQRTGPCVHTT